MAMVIVLSLCLFLSGCGVVGTDPGAGNGINSARDSAEVGSGEEGILEGTEEADSVEAYVLAAEECLEKGEKAEAAQYFYKAYLLDESMSELALEAARLYIEAGDYESAAGILDGGTGVSYAAVLFGEEDLPGEVSDRRRELEKGYMELLLELKVSLEQELYDIENIHDILSWDIFAEDRQEEWRGFYELAEGLDGWAQVWQLEDGSWLGVYPGGYIYFGEMSGGLRSGQGRWLRYYGVDGTGETPDQDGAVGNSGAAGVDPGEATDEVGAAGTVETPYADDAAGIVASTEEDGAAGNSDGAGADSGEATDEDGAAGTVETPYADDAAGIMAATAEDGAAGKSGAAGSAAGEEAEGISDTAVEEDADISGAVGTAKSISGEEAVGISGVAGAASGGMCAAVYYEGEWAEDRPNGMGLYCRKYGFKYGGDTVIYEMEFADGRAQGEGIMALLSDDPDMVGDCDIMAADGYLEPGFADGDESTPPHAVWPEIAGRVIPRHEIAVPGI